MAELKTQPTSASVSAFLDAIPNEQRRADCRAVLKVMQHATKNKPVMWGSSIVGFGRYHYKYASGRQGDWFLVGFSPRKTDLTLYLMGGLHHHAARLKRLGKHTTGKGCLYIKRLSDVNLEVLADMVAAAVLDLRQTAADAKPAQKKA